MFQLSSSTTLFLKVFLPCLWLAFFGAFLITVILLDDPYIMGFPMIFFQVGLISFLLVGFIFFYFTTFKLKRVDADETHLYVSTYFRNFRYSFESVEKVKVTNYNLLHLATLTFFEAGSFGKKIVFILSQRNLKKFLESYPEKTALFEG